MHALNNKRTRRRIFAGTVLAALIACLALGGTVAALNASTSNSNNRVSTGTVTIQDNDGGSSALFSLSGMKPGDTSSACIKVTYTGSLASSVRLYGSVAGTGLGSYASLQITRGSYSGAEPSFPSCTNFTADSTTYISGQSAGVMYAGTLAAFPTSWASGQADPTAGSPAAWITNTTQVYKLQITLGDNVTAAGKNATQTFTWEAQNS